MRKNIYLPFVPLAKVDYTVILKLYINAGYNKNTKCYDTVSFGNNARLCEMLGISKATVYRILKRQDAYKDYCNFISTVNDNTITVCADIRQIKAFVVLTKREIEELMKHNDTRLIQYYIYQKYYIGYNRGSNDSTVSQILNGIGISASSANNKQKIADYNKILTAAKLLTITVCRDEKGHQRNIYKLKE